MNGLGDKEALGRRLGLCAAAAVGLYAALERLGPRAAPELWARYGGWACEHKVQTIALLAAALWVLSMAVWPEEADEKMGVDTGPGED